jgi:hypothetical protein
MLEEHIIRVLENTLAAFIAFVGRYYLIERPNDRKDKEQELKKLDELK